MASETSAQTSSKNSNGEIQVSAVFSHPLSIKLDESNFLLWRQEALAMIRGHGLYNHIESTASPSKVRSDGSLNAELQVWEQRDQLLVSWLLSSIGSNFLPHLIGCSSAYEIWNKIESFYMSQSRVRIMQYKKELQCVKKEGLTMSDYLLKVKNLVDSLGYAGCAVSVEDHILHILSGLGIEYNAVSMIVNIKKESYSVGEVSSLLLQQEKMLEEQLSLSDSFTANLVLGNQRSYNHNSNSGRGSGFRPRQYYQNGGNQNTGGPGGMYGQNGNNRGNRGRDGKFRFNQNNQNRLL